MDSISQDISQYFGTDCLFEGALLINLEDRKDRLIRSLSELKSVGLEKIVCRLDAYKHDYPMYGCSVSHLEAVKYARWKKWKSVVIFEDDIKICEGYSQNASKTLEDLKALDWGLFQFGAILPDPAHLQEVTENLFKFDYAFAGHAFALHENTYDFIINNYICEPDRGNWSYRQHYHFDAFLNNEAASQFDAFSAKKILISQYPGHSDTWEGSRDYTDVMDNIYKDIEIQNHGTKSVGKKRKTINKEFSKAHFAIPFSDANVSLSALDSESLEHIRFLFGERCKDHPRIIYSDYILQSDGTQLKIKGGASNIYFDTWNMLRDAKNRFQGRMRVGLLIDCVAISIYSKVIVFLGLPSEQRPMLMLSLLNHLDCKYVTSDMIFIKDYSTKVEGYYQPLMVCTENVSEFNKQFNQALGDNYQFSTPQGLLIQPEAYTSEVEGDLNDLDTIVICNFEANAESHLKPISDAEAVSKAVWYLRNTENLPQRGLTGLTQLMKSVDVFELQYCDIQGITEIASQFLEQS